MGLEDLKAKDVMLGEFFSLLPDDAIVSAKLRMARIGVGGAPVVDEEMKLLGVITHRDIELSGMTGSKLKVKDLMTREVISVEEGTSLMDIVKIMRKKGYQRIPVLRKEKIVGFVTQSCIIDALYESL